MIKKLLLLLLLSISIQGFAQALAYPAPDLDSCNDTFDLTSQNSVILGDQSPSDFNVAYHHSMSDAMNMVTEIVNPAAYTGFDGEVIYASVYSSIDSTVAVTSFNLLHLDVSEIPDVDDITVCNSYTLPALPDGFNYYTDAGGINMIPEGTILTDTQIVYVYSSPPCLAEVSFEVTIMATPSTPVVSNVTACDSYTLPALPIGQSYHFASGGNSPVTFATITNSMMIYVFAESATSPNCTAESDFIVTINSTPPVPQLEDVYACASFTLPALPPGVTYHTVSGGGAPTEIFLGTLITTTQTVWVSAETGSIPNCTSESSFTIYITDMAPIELAPLVACDENGDGVALFDLTAVAAGIDFNGQGSAVSFYETLTDAEMGFPGNSLSSPYIAMFNNQTIYVRIGDEECFQITTLLLVAGDCTNNTISGVVTLDSDLNGCTASDNGMANAALSCTNGTSTKYAYANADGEYEFTNVPSGSNAVSVGLMSGYSATPTLSTVVLAGTGESGTADFCVVPPPPFNDVEVLIVPQQTPRPGFPVTYIMVVNNIGTTILSGSATFNFAAWALDVVGSNPIADNSTASSMTFDFVDLEPMQSLNFYMNFTVKTPPTVIAGNIIASTATVVTDQTDENPGNNTDELLQTVVNSYDPNEMIVHEGPYVSANETENYLHYTIRFQNTGSADAVNVRLENELDPLLDWSTFQPISASHTYQAERDNNNVVFRYNNIMLPGSSVDEPGSHGYVTYRIKPLGGFDVGDIISNTANIFFDFNAPITTNTATTQIQVLAVNQNQFSQFQVYPNPASGIVNIHCETANRLQVEIVDLQGKVVFSGEKIVSNNIASIDVSGIAGGMYFLRINDGSNVAVKKLIVR